MHTVIVTTAQALSAEQRKEVLRLAAEKAGSKDVTLSEKVDETILGGVIMQIGSRVYDASVRAQFTKLRS